jgi:uncharacterized membrane protein
MQNRITLPFGASLLRTLASLRLLPLLSLLVVLIGAPYPAMGRAIWTDEAFSISYAAHQSFGDLLEDVRKNEETPPLYFVLLRSWIGGLGQSEPATRALSLGFGALAATAAAWFAERTLGPRAAIIASAAFALSPMLHLYLVEARGYTLTMLLAVLCMIAFERFLRHPESRRSQAAYLLSAVALFLTSYFGVALLAAQGSLLLWKLRQPQFRDRCLGAVALIGLAAVTLTAWWLPALIYQVRIAPAVTASVHHGAIDYELFAISCFLAISSLAGNLAEGWRLPFWLLAVLATSTLALASALHPQAEARALLLRTLLLPAAFLMAMVFVMGTIAPRYMIMLLPGIALAAGLGAEALEARRPMLGGIGAAVLLSGLLALTSTAQRAPTVNAWAEVSAILADEVAPSGDAIVLQPPYNQRVLEYYYAGEAPRLLGAHHYDEFYVRELLPFRETWTVEQLEPRLAGSRRVWLLQDAFFKQMPELDLPYKEVGRWKAGNLHLTLYETALP